MRDRKTCFLTDGRIDLKMKNVISLVFDAENLKFSLKNSKFLKVREKKLKKNQDSPLLNPVTLSLNTLIWCTRPNSSNISFS